MNSIKSQPFTSGSSKALVYILALLVFVAAAITIYPYYQYRIISDDFSYFAITRRYLNGDWATAINAYWSPLNIWLLVILVKCSNWPLEFAAYVLNCISFSFFLLLNIKLFIHLIDSKFEVYGAALCMALFWALNIPVTHFADALNGFLLVGCLLILIRKDFLQRPVLWILFGWLSAVAYFSKAYSFYILPLTATVLVFVFLKKQGLFTLRKWLGILLVTTGSMILFALPWLLLIHNKYGIWVASTAGAINTSWAIKGYIYFSDQYSVIVPPAYTGGLSCWEDMWINRGGMLSPFSSPTLFLKQILRIGNNTLKWFEVMAEFSPFYFPIWLLSVFYLLRKKIKDYDWNRSAVMISFILFPIGYFTLSFGIRYLWFTGPLVMVTGLFFFRQYLLPVLKHKAYKIFLLVYFISWLPGTLQEVKTNFNVGKEEYFIAKKLVRMNLAGSFIANNYDYQKHFRISWYSNSPFYIHFGSKWTTDELIAEARKQKVEYYYYFYNGANDDYLLKDANGNSYPEMTSGKIPGLKIFRLSPN